MLCSDVIKVIEKAYPIRFALEWDNVGLLAGRDNKEVESIYIALDATEEVIRAAISEKVDMLVTHHPLIFGGIKKINNQDLTGRCILDLIRNDISYYAMHTNYDVCGMADLSGEMLKFVDPEVLEVTSEEDVPMGIGKIADLEKEVSLGECCDSVKAAFHLENVRVFGELEQRVKRVAICPGSGKSVIGEALKKKADVLITGDIGHHDGIDSVAEGLAIIDAGHYGIEHIFINDMKKYLEENLSGVKVIAAPIRHPFQVV